MAVRGALKAVGRPTRAVPNAALDMAQAPGRVGTLARLSWALMDAARTPYFVLVNIYIFAPYFTTVVVGDPAAGQAIWARNVAIAAALIAVLGPVLGAVADAGGRRKPWILASLALAVPSMSALWLARPHLGTAGGAGGLTPVLVALVVAGVAFELSVIFQNAMLPSVAPEAGMGRLSGLAAALGNLAAIAVFALFVFAWLLPTHPAFGLSHADYEPERAVGLLSAAWLVAFSLPLLLFTPDSSGTGLGAASAVRDGIGTLARTIRGMGRHRNIGRFLVARMVFNDAIVVILFFSGIYAGGLFHWDSTALTIYGMSLTAVAVASGLLGGLIDDRIGSKRALILCLCGSLATTTASLLILPGRVLFLAVSNDPAAGLFGTAAERAYLAVSVLGTFFIVMNLVSSRSMMARLTPPRMSAEFFGLFSLSGSATAFLGPLAVGVVTDATHSQRAGFAVVLAFLAAGLLLLLGVREERARPDASPAP